MKVKSFQFRLGDIDHRDLKTFCAQHGFSMQEFVYKAVEEYKKKWAV